jgi:hypothetical protein
VAAASRLAVHPSVALRLPPVPVQIHLHSWVLWRKFHHPRKSGWNSDVVGSGQISPAERSFVSRYLYMHFEQSRFVEKTPESCFHSYFVPEILNIKTYDQTHQWCFALIENWRDLKTESFARIVA